MPGPIKPRNYVTKKPRNYVTNPEPDYNQPLGSIEVGSPLAPIILLFLILSIFASIVIFASIIYISITG